MGLPLPRPFSDTPGGPLINAMNGMYQNQVNRANAEYAPYQAQANAMKTMQEAKWLPYQYQMAALSNPMLWQMAQNNPVMQKQIQDMMKNTLPSQDNNQFPNIPAPGINKNSVFGKLLGKLFGDSDNSANAINQSPDFGAKNKASNQEIDQVIDSAESNLDKGNPASAGLVPGTYNTSGTAAADQLGKSGGLSGANSLSAADAVAKAMQAKVTGQTTNQNEQQKQRSLLLSSQSQIATDALNSLEGYSRNYDKSSYTGQYAGTTPSAGKGSIPTLPGGTIAPEQLTDRYANQFLTSLSALGDTPAGKTDDGRELLAAGKVDRSLDKDAKKELVGSFRAKLHRINNARDFTNDFYKNNPNATDEDLVGMMNAYNRHAPSYDYENGKPLPQNDKRFKEFTSQKALASYIENGDYNPSGKVEPKYKQLKGNKISLKGGLIVPKEFDSKKHFQDWFYKQPLSTQKAYNEFLSGGQ